MITLRDEEIMLKLRDFEDSFVERKSVGDSQDWLKTCVGFANTAAVGYPAIMFVGVRDEGTVEGTADLDSLQKSLGKKLAAAYPTIQYVTKVLSEQGKQFLAVLVPGSPQRPHFAGQSYVRVGSETNIASETQFDHMIASRNSKAAAILQWKDKEITVNQLHSERNMLTIGRIASSSTLFVRDCNQFYVTLAHGTGGNISHPLRIVDISFDHQRARLALEIQQA